MEEFLSFVTIDVWEIIFTWVNLLILFLLMKKILFKPVKAILDKREKDVGALYSDAEKASAEADRLRSEYSEKLSSAKEEADEIVRSATRKAQLAEEEILRDAHGKADRIIERAEENIELEKQNAINEVKNEISEMAVTLASAIIKKEVSEDEHREMIDSFIDSVDSGKKQAEGKKKS